MLNLLRRCVALIVLIISLGLIVWASFPDQRDTITQTITPEMMQVEIAGSILNLPTREVKLEWPARMHIGEEGVISLSFQPALVNQEINTLPAGEAYPYNDYNLMVEGRYDVAGMTVNPANPTRESMPAGQTVKFKWQVSTARKGTYAGTVWLSLRYLPLDGKPGTQVPIYIHEIEIKAGSLLGLNESSAYILGTLGVLVSIVLLYSDLLVFARRKTGKKP